MTGLASRHKHIKQKLGLIISSTLILSIILSAIFLPLTKTASAIKADSISKVQGPTKGGEEVIIKGEGFLKEERVSVREIITAPSISEGTAVLQEDEIVELGIDSKILITEAGVIYELKSDGSLIELSESKDFGLAESSYNYGDWVSITTNGGKTLSYYYDDGSLGSPRVVIVVCSPSLYGL